MQRTSRLPGGAAGPAARRAAGVVPTSFSSRGVSDMAKQESLGIKALESIHWYVHDLERSR
ncbi:MAG: hypothetical protein EOO72_13245, partial [Myxococcaceae bacterium]